MTTVRTSAQLERLMYQGAWQQLIDHDEPADERVAAYALATAAAAASQLQEFDKAMTLAVQALGRCDGRWPEVQARAACARAEVLGARGELGASDAAARQAYELIESTATDWRAHLEVLMGLVAADYGSEEGVEQACHGADALEQSGHGFACSDLVATATRLEPLDSEGALSMLERATAVGPPHARSRAHQHLAMHYAIASQTGLAQHHLDQAAELGPGVPAPSTTAMVASIEGHIHRANGAFDKAERSYERSADAHRLAPEVAVDPRRQLVLNEVQRGRLSAAVERLAARPHAEDVHHAVHAVLAAHEADLEAWRRHFAPGRALAHRPRPMADTAALWLDAAKAWGASGHADQRLQALRVAAAISPDLRESIADATAATEHPHLGPWLAFEALGSSVLGSVWSGRHHLNDQRAAVKVWNPAQRRSTAGHHLQGILHGLMGLRHPHVATVFSHGTLGPFEAERVQATAGALWVAETHGEGTLADLVGTLSWREVRRALLAVLAGLAHAHARGVLHLDLKPSNVIYDRRDGAIHVRVADFAIAGTLRAGRRDRSILRDSNHLAPEQLEGRLHELTKATDLFAAGCLAWELVTGTTPWRGDTPEEVHRAQQRGLSPLQPTSPVPAGFETWLQRLMSIDAVERFPLAAEAAAGLRSLGDADPSATPVPAGRRAYGPRRGSEPAPRLPTRWPDPPPGPPVLGRPAPSSAFVGRHPERDLLWAALSDTLATQRGNLVAVRGPSGAGRSALIRWLATTAEEVGAARSVLVQGPPGRALQGAIRNLLHLQAGGSEAIQARIEERLPQLDPEQRTALRQLFEGTPHPAQGLAVATALRSQAPVRPLVVGLTARPAHQPLVLRMARELFRRDAPVLVLLELDESADGAAERAIADLLDASTARTVSLALPDSATFALIVRSWAPVSDEGIDALFQATNGHLAAASQQVEHLAASGVLIEEGSSIHDAISGVSPETYWEQRLSQATEGHPALVTDALAAAFLPEGDCERSRWDAVRQNLGLRGEPLRGLCDDGVMHPTREGWELADPALTLALAAHLRRSPQRAAVARIAQNLARSKAPEQQAELALLTGRPDAALGPLIRAAAQAQQLGDTLAAERSLGLYDRALTELHVPATDRRWLGSHLLRSQAAIDQGVPDEALRYAEHALQLVPSDSEERARALDAVAAAAERSGDLTMATKAWEDAAAQWKLASKPLRGLASSLQRVDAYRRRGNAAAASAMLAGLPSHPKAQLTRARVAALRGDPDADKALSMVGVHGVEAGVQHITRALLASRTEALDAARAHLATARRAVEASPGQLRTALALTDAHITAREGSLAHASRLAEAALGHRREPTLRAWGLALWLLHHPRQDTARVGELESELEQGGRCDPELAWAIDRAAAVATDPTHSARLARLASALWQRLWRHART